MKNENKSNLNKPLLAIIAVLACLAVAIIILSAPKPNTDTAENLTAYELYHAAVSDLEAAKRYSIESHQESYTSPEEIDYRVDRVDVINFTVIRPLIGETKMKFSSSSEMKFSSSSDWEPYNEVVFYKNGYYYRDDPSGKIKYSAAELNLDKPIDEYVLSLHRQRVLNFPETVVLESSMTESNGVKTLSFVIKGDSIHRLLSGVVDETSAQSRLMRPRLTSQKIYHRM